MTAAGVVRCARCTEQIKYGTCSELGIVPDPDKKYPIVDPDKIAWRHVSNGYESCRVGIHSAHPGDAYMLREGIMRELDMLAGTASNLRSDDEGPDSILYAGYLDDLILDCRRLTYAVERAIRYPRHP